MRLICLFCLLCLVTSQAQAQPVKSKPARLTCEMLCAELFAAIRANPDKLVMRLEEALVINESCAGEIVTAAIDAVNAEPAQVRKIVETAMSVAPARLAVITAAVKHYSAPVLVVNAQEEVRRAELPDGVKVKPLQGEEVRRAELPLATQSSPVFEVRRAEPVSTAQIVEQKPEPEFHLMSVPKAKPLK
ncbi:hypothetical protein [Prosthecobacter sp.]|uniref:hypothetical protein n=1 Tax=Prosthecobacter sp. TaxID=1965333 RepID=UPI002AB9485B|nr:hypothetical protein [Prosthecobacter sp.]MDZ4403312.1 hypothetical protein [Prosthecobacter sp.]